MASAGPASTLHRFITYASKHTPQALESRQLQAQGPPSPSLEQHVPFINKFFFVAMASARLRSPSRRMAWA
jgi:hypothetical protein